MIVKIAKTYYAKIYVGMREQYSDDIHKINEAYELCQDYCNKIGLCVTVTPTKFIYKNGNEDGFIVGLINYPKFTMTAKKLEHISFDLANKLMINFKQLRVSVEFPKKTYMLENKNLLKT
jgi:ferredoxin